jgi:hypothetical protein
MLCELTVPLARGKPATYKSKLALSTPRHARKATGDNERKGSHSAELLPEATV